MAKQHTVAHVVTMASSLLGSTLLCRLLLLDLLKLTFVLFPRILGFGVKSHTSP